MYWCLQAFDYVGWKWATYIVAMGALLGIVTTTLVSDAGLTLLACRWSLPSSNTWGSCRSSTRIETNSTLSWFSS